MKKTNELIEQSISIDNGQTTISYVQKGNGESTLLFLHGWCINKSYWNEQMDFFAKTHTVYALDLAGFGNSTRDRNDWSIDRYAKDVNSFINELALENVFIIGHSMSGLIMLQSSLNDSSRMIGFVGVDNYKDVDVKYSPEHLENFQIAINSLKEDFRVNAPKQAEIMLFHSSTPENITNRIKEDFKDADQIVGYESIVDFINFSRHLPAKLEQSPFKLFLINSEATPTNESGLVKHCNKGFEVMPVGHTGHYPMVENPKKFNELLEIILKNLD
jgi:pimeloyl-ACP methyl ester carboxylesterase